MLQSFLRLIERQQAPFLATFALVLALGARVNGSTRPVYQSRVMLVIPAGKAWAALFQFSDDPFGCIMVHANPDPVATQLQILRSERLQAEARQRAGVSPPDRDLKVEVTSEHDTNVSWIVVEAPGAGDATRLARCMVELYREWWFEERASKLIRSIAFVRAQRNSAVLALRGVEREVRRARRVRRGGAEAVLRMRRLDQEAQMARAQYQNLTQKLQKLETIATGCPSGPRIIEPPTTPARPVRSGSALLVLLWTAAGLVLALAVAVARDARGRRAPVDEGGLCAR